MPDDSNFSGPPPSAAETASAQPVDHEYERIGPYTILQKVGEGGMGTVYVAEQAKPVRRRVALKVIKRGMDSKQVIARFEAERQALAMMDHSAIATIYDAGTTPDGRPFFAMEYVQGVPITEHCDRHRLGIAERLEIFLQVCEGVQHAHQKAVIHRDLKPSNVLVAIQDGHPTVKIIDFGLAKALAQSLTDRTLYTEIGSLVGTPEYMSPEQADKTGQDVDTRSDVYSLGVMLYELLVGALPFESGDLRRAGIDEIRRRIRDEEPRRPSTRLSSLGERSLEVAQRRRAEPTSLRRLLRGDLDWITMHALNKDRTRRYASPSDLAEDIRRHLKHEPVVAHAPTAGYRASKFVRRHRLGVAAATVMLAGLAAGAVGSTVGLVRARRAEAEARLAEAEARRQAEAKGQVAEFLQGLFKVSNPNVARGNSVTARELLDKAAGTIDARLSDQPEMQAEMSSTMGFVYLNLGLYDMAESLSAKALEIDTRLLGSEHPKTLSARNDLAVVYNFQGRYSEAEQLLSKVLDTQTRVLGPDHKDTIGTMRELADVYLRQKRLPDAERLLTVVVDKQSRAFGPESDATTGSMTSLASLELFQGKYPEAERLLVRLVEIGRRVNGPDHPNTLVRMGNLANVYLYEGRYDEAERLQTDVLAVRTRVLGPDHPFTRESMYNLACLWARRGDRAQGMKWLRQALEGRGNPAFDPARDPDLNALHGPEFDDLVNQHRHSPGNS
jgi:eukaryotic-like serine/threonine-protein kinase